MKTAASKPNIRVAGYIRVSTDDQVDGHSLDAQQRAITLACEERGWQVVRWYRDEGVSAHTDDISKRPAFHQLVTDAELHAFDIVVVHKLDRFARSVVVALSTFKRFADLTLTFLSVTEAGMDFTSPMGKVMFTLLASFAEYYSENLGLETRKGKTERKLKGLHNGLVPFGYRSVGGAVAEPDPDTAEGARLAFRLAADGKSFRDIAQALNIQGYRTAGNMRRGVFTKDTVRDMLNNRFYLGELPEFEAGTSRRIRSWVAGQHPALIDVDTFDAARQAIAGRTSASGAQRRNASVYSLSGLLRCVHCGERMRVLHNQAGRIRYYCRNKAQGLGCTGRGAYLDSYEQQVQADLANFRLPPEWKTIILQQIEQAPQNDAAADQRRQLEQRRERLKALFAWGDLTPEQYQAERDQVEQELARLMPAAPAVVQLDRVAAYVESLGKAWQDGDHAQRNQMASLIYEEVWVDGPRVAYVKPRPEVEPLFQVRTGAAQPIIVQSDELSHIDEEKWQGRPRWDSNPRSPP